MSLIGAPTLNSVLTPSSFTATASQTTFSPNGGYTAPYVLVMRNGAFLGPSDYTATNGTTVVLNTACSAGDQVAIWAFGAFNVANVGAASAGGAVYENSQTISSNYTVSSGKNALSVGPITVSVGATVSIPSGSRWVIL